MIRTEKKRAILSPLSTENLHLIAERFSPQIRGTFLERLLLEGPLPRNYLGIVGREADSLGFLLVKVHEPHPIYPEKRQTLILALFIFPPSLPLLGAFWRTIKSLFSASGDSSLAMLTENPKLVRVALQRLGASPGPQYFTLNPYAKI